MKTAAVFGITGLTCFAVVIAVRHYHSVEYFLAAGCVAALIALASWFVASKPDDDEADAGMSLSTRRFLALYLIALGAILIAALTWLLWFDFTPLYTAPNVKGSAEVIVRPAPFGHIETWWWGRVWLSREMQLFLLAIAAGALGSYIHAIKSLADFLGNRSAKTSWFWFYVTRPYLGAALAALFYAVIRGGFMTGTSAEANAVSPYGVVAICGLVGMFADRATLKLSEVFDTLFRTDDSRTGKLGAADPKQLDPATVPMNGKIRDVAVRGSGLGGTAKVRVDNEDRDPKTVGGDTVIFTLRDAEATARRQLTIRLVTSGGDVSKPLTLHISDLQITPNPLPAATAGQAYAQVQLVATGGTGAGTYRWNVEGLPKGLTADAAGKIEGTPAAATEPAQVKITVTDHDGATAAVTLPLTIT